MVTKAVEKTFWTDINQVPKQYPWLTDNLECEIAIIGGGVTAALCALRFAEAGCSTIMLSASPIGFGGTAASAGMMSIDAEQCINTLVDKIGADRAMMTTQLLTEAVNNIETLCNGFDDDCGFRRMDSLRYADDVRNAETLRREYSLRLHNGINVQLLTNINVEYVYTAKNGRTDDGLPVLGRKPEEDKIAYALCFGDDGLLYSEIAGRLLLEQYQGKSN
ncbi:MAG: FAD-dependent oxidoreductase, partial [Oscillospiraceae bacterium]|nr:FAD-dependent oxidoreductase [Oscillospiraceae bacterium]